MSTFKDIKPRRALVIGGSLGGLFAGTLLRDAGWQVDIFERSPRDLDSRGGGIVLQPQVVELFRRIGVDLGSLKLGVESTHRTVFRTDGSIQSKHRAPQMQTSWPLIYSTLKGIFGDAHYHRGKSLVGITENGDETVTASFGDGTRETGDLLIGADGGNSVVRGLLWPDAVPTYAGYVAWRGLVPEDDMPPLARQTLHGDFGFANNTGSHVLGYLVPGENNDVHPGARLYNWVWYRVADATTLADIMTDRDGNPRGHAMPEGLLADRWVARLEQEATLLLPPPFREVVTATPHPFAQAIRDLAVDHMQLGHVALVGDAAAIPRPHTAASTAKAAMNALTLVDALQASPNDITRALVAWEPGQVALGKHLLRQGSQTGNYLLFHQPPVAKIG